MSCSFELLVGKTCVTYGSNHFDSSLLLPFQTRDLLSTLAVDEGGSLKYEASPAVVGRRLDLLGFTMASATAAYARSLDDARDGFPDYDWPPTLAAWQDTVASRASSAHVESFLRSEA